MPSPQEDPVLKSSRREAIVTFICWLAAAGYTIGYCWRNAYGRTMDDLTFVWGLPDWVFWGIVVPWGACLVVCVLFAFCFMKDEPLEADDADVDPMMTGDVDV